MPNINSSHRPFFISFLGWGNVLIGTLVLINSLLTTLVIFSLSKPDKIGWMVKSAPLIVQMVIVSVFLWAAGYGLLKLKKWGFYLESVLLGIGIFFPFLGLFIEQNLTLDLTDIFRSLVVAFLIYKLFRYRNLFS